MRTSPDNPYALYVYCDGSMDYDSRNTGGVGFEIVFPDFVELENIQESIGKYEGGNIERLELEAILQGMNEVLRLFQNEKEKLVNINTIIVITDRYGLNDQERTSPYRIREWRKNKWHNYEEKAIKNSDLLDKIDKTRKKISNTTYCRLSIQYKRRKYNKKADKLARAGKKQAILKDDIALKGIKIGRRKYNDIEVNYILLEEKTELHVHVFKKDPVHDQWEISVEICEGKLIGKKLKIYSDDELASKLQRLHEYSIRIKKVFNHHITIYRTLRELKKLST
jgi:ribonuclease HI